MESLLNFYVIEENQPIFLCLIFHIALLKKSWAVYNFTCIIMLNLGLRDILNLFSIHRLYFFCRNLLDFVDESNYDPSLSISLLYDLADKLNLIPMTFVLMALSSKPQKITSKFVEYYMAKKKDAALISALPLVYLTLKDSLIYIESLEKACQKYLSYKIDLLSNGHVDVPDEFDSKDLYYVILNKSDIEISCIISRRLSLETFKELAGFCYDHIALYKLFRSLLLTKQLDLLLSPMTKELVTALIKRDKWGVVLKSLDENMESNTTNVGNNMVVLLRFYFAICGDKFRHESRDLCHLIGVINE